MNRPTHFLTLRRLLALAAVLVMLGALLAGCGTEDKDNISGTTDTSEPTVQTTESTQEPTDEPTEEPTEEPTDPEVTEPPVTIGIVNADNLNVRTEPYTTADILKRLAINTQVEILEQKIVDGVNWGRTEEGWINMNYVTIEDGLSVDPTAPSTGVENENNIDSGKTNTGTDTGKTNTGTGTDSGKTNTGTDKTDTGTSSTLVTNGKTTVLGYGMVYDVSSLAVRYGPGTSYSKATYISAGQRMPYYQQSGIWVRIKSGWVSTKYFDITSTLVSGTGKVTTDLNIRQEASSSSTKVGTYSKGDTVEILEVSGNWGRTSEGWISLSYVIFDTDSTTSTGGTGGTNTTYTTGTGTVTAYSLYIRKSASISSTPLSHYDQGDTVEILEVSGYWGKVEYASGKYGWISLKYVSMDGSNTSSTTNGTITASSLHIRKGPGTSYATVGKTLSKGDTVTILEKSGNWGKIEYASGKYGWISLTYVKQTTGKYTITVKTPDNGTMKASSSSASNGATITLTATPASGYVLSTVSVVDASGNVVAVTNNTTFTMPAANVTVTATFVKGTVKTYGITVDSEGNGSVSTNPDGAAAQGVKVYLTVSPDDGYALSTLNVKETSSGKTVTVTSSSYFTMPAADVTITATFAESTAARYTVNADTIEHGSIVFNKSSAAKGETVSMTITPDAGYTLKSISVKDQNSKAVTVSGSGTSRTFTMPEGDVTVSAEFTATQYTVTLSKTGSGTVTINPTKCSVGTEVTVSATAASGYQLDELKVYGPNNEVVELSDGTFTMPAYNVTVKATFSTIPHDISVSYGEGGTATADMETAGQGTKVTLTLKPDEGYIVDKVTVKYGDDKTVTVSGSGNTRTFTMPAEDAEVEVSFKLATYTVTTKATYCKVTATPASTNMGETVEVTIVSTKSGYSQFSLTVKNGSTELDCTQVSSSVTDGIYTYVYTFEMPAGNVTVTAAFAKS